MSKLNPFKIVLVGKTNSGKSSLVNNLTGQKVSIVSDVAGTTTDPVVKIFELIGAGPVRFVDTAGINDTSELGKLRIQSTENEIKSADLVLIIGKNSHDIDVLNSKIETSANKIFVQTFGDECGQKHENAIIVSNINKEGIDKLLSAIKTEISQSESEVLVADIIKKGQTIIHVIPIDGAAPKDRLILPQNQLLRECLDYGIISIVVGLDELKDTLKKFPSPDLVVCDSQVFGQVSKIVDEKIKLTSYSILFAKQKGDIKLFSKNVQAISKLNDKSNVLIFEYCAHNKTHEDIGSVKIPTLIKKQCKANPKFNFMSGKQIPTDLKNIDLVIVCGGCMQNKMTMQALIKVCAENNIPITNYGVTIAYCNGILERATKHIC